MYGYYGGYGGYPNWGGGWGGGYGGWGGMGNCCGGNWGGNWGGGGCGTCCCNPCCCDRGHHHKEPSTPTPPVTPVPPATPISATEITAALAPAIASAIASELRTPRYGPVPRYAPELMSSNQSRYDPELADEPAAAHFFFGRAENVALDAAEDFVLLPLYTEDSYGILLQSNALKIQNRGLYQVTFRVDAHQKSDQTYPKKLHFLIFEKDGSVRADHTLEDSALQDERYLLQPKDKLAFVYFGKEPLIIKRTALGVYQMNGTPRTPKRK